MDSLSKLKRVFRKSEIEVWHQKSVNAGNLIVDDIDDVNKAEKKGEDIKPLIEQLIDDLDYWYLSFKALGEECDEIIAGIKKNS